MMASGEQQTIIRPLSEVWAMAESSRALAGNPLRFIRHEHDLHLKFCDLLEAIADDLPHNVHRAQATAAVTALENLPAHHRFEETTLFPLLRKRAKPRDNIDLIIDHLAMEHAVDESLASELGEELELLCAGRDLANANLTGYMLRGFFENYRRHVGWENVVLLPLAERRLSADDLDHLTVVLQEARPDALLASITL
jgi:hemerythrin-like domain-containing protein